MKLVSLWHVKSWLLWKTRFSGGNNSHCLQSPSSLLPATPCFLEKPRPLFLYQETISKIRYICPTQRVAASVLTTPPCFAKGSERVARKTHAVPGREVWNGAGMGWGHCHSHVLPKKSVPFYVPFGCHWGPKHALVIAIVCRISCGSQPDDHSLLKSLLYRLYSASIQDT